MKNWIIYLFIVVLTGVCSAYMVSGAIDPSHISASPGQDGYGNSIPNRNSQVCGDWSYNLWALYAVNGAGVNSSEQHGTTDTGTMYMDDNGTINYAHPVGLNGTYRGMVNAMFDGSYHVTELRVWNFNGSGATARGFRNVDIHASTNYGSSYSLIMDNVEFSQATGSSNYTGFTVDIPDGDYTDIVISATNNWGDGSWIGLAEVQFVDSGGAPPPPSGSALDPAHIIASPGQDGSGNSVPNRNGQVCGEWVWNLWARYAVNGAGLDAFGQHGTTDTDTMYMDDTGIINFAHPVQNGAYRGMVNAMFDDSYYITALKVWNFNGGGTTNRGFKNVDIHVSNNYGQSYSLAVDNVQFSQASGNSSYTGFNVDIPDGYYTDIVISATNNWGDGSWIGLAEVQFMTPGRIPVAFYNFNGQNANDSSGYGSPANGTVYGATYTDGGGGNYVLTLDNNDYVTFYNPSKLDLHGDGLKESFTMWVAPFELGTGEMEILTKGTSGYSIRYDQINDRILFSHKTDDLDWDEYNNIQWNTSIVRGGYLPPWEWHHVACVYNAEDDDLSKTPSHRIYIDGKLKAIARGAWDNPYQVGDWVQLGSRYGQSGFFYGYIDDVAIYNGALSDSEVRDLCWMHKGQPWDPSPCPATQPYAPTNTQLSWRIGDGSTHQYVYMGTDPGALQYKTYLPPSITTYDPGTLQPNTTYWWAILSYNGQEHICSDYWSFTTFGYDTTAQIVQDSYGTSEIKVNNQWHMSPSHCVTFVNNDYAKDFADAGTLGYDFECDMPACDYEPFDDDIWIGPGQYNFMAFANRMERLLGQNPNARIMMRVPVAPPMWWVNSHSSEWELIDNGSSISAYFNSSANNPRSGPFVSQASTTFRNESADAWRDIIEYMEKTGYAQHIVGYQLCGMRTRENYPWDCDRSEVMGYSNAFKNGFRNWLRTKYNNNVGTLRSSWNNSSVTFDNAEPPSRNLCAEYQGSRTFRNAGTRMQVIDFYRYKNELNVETLDFFAGVIKDAHTQPKIVTCFYGMMNEFEGRDKFAHNALGRLCELDNLDGVLCTASYTQRLFGAGADMERGPSYSLQLNDKIWYNDNDMATYLSGYSDQTYGEQQMGWTHNEGDTKEMMQRAAGFALSKNMHAVYLELQEGIYNTPGLMSEVQTINNMFNNSVNYNCTSVAQILVVVDEVSNSYCTWESKLTRDTLRYCTWEYTKIGAPFDQILLDDLSKANASQYKLVIFQNCYNMTNDQRNMINAIKNSGRTLVFVYAAGYFNHTSQSNSNMTNITSFNMGMGNESLVPLRTNIQTGHSLANAINNAGYGTFGKTESVARRVYVSDGGATTLGKYEGRGEVSMALKQHSGWNSIFLANAYAPAGVWREIAKWAGVHIYNHNNDAFYANKSYICLHANGSGNRTIYFPSSKKVYDALTGAVLHNGTTSYSKNYSNGETMILRLQ